MPLTYSVDPDDVLGNNLTVRSNMNDAAELDELLGTVGALGFGIEDLDENPNAGDADKDDE